MPRYEPPPGASPGVAAWLFERGELPRAMAAALVNMAAEGYPQIDQSGDCCSVTQLRTETSMLQPEEDALARSLFQEYDCFDFEQLTPELTGVVRCSELNALKSDPSSSVAQAEREWSCLG